MGHKKWWDIVSKKRSKGLEKSEKDGKTGKLIVGSANFWYALGASLISLGGAALSMDYPINYSEVSRFSIVSDAFVLLTGIFMILGASSIEKKMGKQLAYPSYKELWGTNKWLIFAIATLIVWAFLAISLPFW